jgi:hypothetical protein
MTATTPRGYPYPLTTDRVADGWDAIRDLAVAVDSDLTAVVTAVTNARTAGDNALDARLDALELDTGWTAPALTAGWSNYSGSFASVGYRRFRGVTYLRGLIKRTTGTATTLFTLPAGFRPAQNGLFPGIAALSAVPVTDNGQPYATASFDLAGVAVRIDINSSGVVGLNQPYAVDGWGTGGVPYLSLSGISFPAEL